MVLDLRIPQNQRYQQVVLDTSVARMLAGELDGRRDHEDDRPTAGTRSPTSSAGTTSSPPTSRRWGSSKAVTCRRAPRSIDGSGDGPTVGMMPAARAAGSGTMHAGTTRERHCRSTWLDRQRRPAVHPAGGAGDPRLLDLPAAGLAYLALSRFKLAAGGYRLRLHRLAQFQEAAVRLASSFISSASSRRCPGTAGCCWRRGAWFLLRRLVAYLRDGRITACGHSGPADRARRCCWRSSCCFAATSAAGRPARLASASRCSTSSSASRRSS